MAADKELRQDFVNHAKHTLRYDYWREPDDEGPATTWLGRMAASVMNYMTYRERVREIKIAAHRMDDSELERRLDEGDFCLVPDEKELQNLEYKAFAGEVVAAVRENDFGVWRYPVPYFGYFGMGAGMYEGITGEAEKGLTYMLAGAVVLLGGVVMKNLLLIHAARKTVRYLEQEGYEKFDNFYREKEPYEFYKARVLGDEG